MHNNKGYVPGGAYLLQETYLRIQRNKYIDI